MKTKPIVIVLAIIIIAVFGYYVVIRKSSNQGGVPPPSGGASVSVFDFDGNGCVGNDGDLAILNQQCPSKGGACNVQGETDPIQAALKFAEASKQYPCE